MGISGEINYNSKYLFAIDDALNGCYDTDGDNIGDLLDVDDDNDGITDTEECSEVLQQEVLFSGIGGWNSAFNLTTSEGSFIVDIYRIDNSFQLEINGTNIASQEIEFEAGINNIKFLDGTQYQSAGIGSIWSLGTANPSTPLRRIIVDVYGKSQILGSKTLNGPLVPMELINGAVFNTLGINPTNTMRIYQSTNGATYHSGSAWGTVLLACDGNLDFDGDGIVNRLDLDSDNDGIADVIEAGGIDNNLDGQIDYVIMGDPSSMLNADIDSLMDLINTVDNGRLTDEVFSGLELRVCRYRQ